MYTLKQIHNQTTKKDKFRTITELVSHINKISDQTHPRHKTSIDFITNAMLNKNADIAQWTHPTIWEYFILKNL